MNWIEGLQQVPLSANVPKHDLVIIGGGLRSFCQLTLESCAFISTARVVLVASGDELLRRTIRALNPRSRSINQREYIVGQFRPDIYRRVSRRVLDEVERGGGVVLVETGSAILTNSVTQLLLNESDKRGLSVRVIPGISCIESVCASLGVDPTASGLQVFQAQNLVAQRAALDPGRAALIIQPGYYDTLWWVGIPKSQPGRYDLLANYLHRFYAAETPMALVRSSTSFETLESSVFWFYLRTLASLNDVISYLDTLFIPPHAPRQLDAGFLEKVQSWEFIKERVSLNARKSKRSGGTSDAKPNQEGRPVPESLLQESLDIERRWRSTK